MKVCHHWHTFLSFCLPLFALAAFGFVILTYEHEYLFRIQEQSLFLDTPLFFYQMMTFPAGLLSWFGTYLTQYLYYPWAGTLILLALWALLMWMLQQTFCIPRQWSVFTLLPVCTLAITVFHLGYWIFYLKMHGYFFASTIGTIAAVALIWLFRLLPGRYHIRTVFLILSSIIGYPLIGCYALLATLAMGILTRRLEDSKRADCIIHTLLALITIIAVPLICYRTLYHSTSISDIWLVGIPQFQTAEKTCTPYYAPYALLALWLIIGSLAYNFAPLKRTKGLTLYVAQLSIFILAGIFTYLNWYKDQNFHLELKMYRYMEQQNWEGMLTTMQEAVRPTRFMSVMKNLALFRLGRQGDEMYTYPSGNCPSVAPFEVRMLQTGGKLLYLNYGQANFCHRWCMEDGVEFGWRVEYLQCMATSMLMNGEKAAAEKYLNILKHTRYYQTWTPDHQELTLMKRLMPDNNQLTSDNMMAEAFLVNHFANRDSNDPLAQEASLMFALQSCNSEVFLQRLSHYLELKPQSRIPIHCQEALCIYQKTDSIPVDEAVSRNYQMFMQKAGQYRGMSIEAVKPLMQEQFGNTFFYDYYFNNYQQPK